MQTISQTQPRVNPHPLTARRMPRRVGTPAPAHVATMVETRRQRVAAQLARKAVRA